MIDRIWASVIPFNWKLGLLVKDHPDMYGPFWILTSLIFSILVAANSVVKGNSTNSDAQDSKSDNNDGNGGKNVPSPQIEFDIGILPSVAFTVYFFGVGLPICINLYRKFVCQHDKLMTFEILSLFGYSNSGLILYSLSVVILPSFLWIIILCYASIGLISNVLVFMY